jgi:predicted HTH transcriptional regulator
MDITDLTLLNEGKTLEFKLNLASKERILRSLVAFANTAGGTMIIGVVDSSKEIIGVEDPIAAELQAANLIADNIAPRLIPDIQIKRYGERYVLVIEVSRSSNAPHFVKREGGRSGIYIRIGSTNRQADDAVIAELRRSLLHQAYDETPLTDIKEEALDKSAIKNDFRDLRSVSSKELETLGLLVKHQKLRVPTIGGYLLYGIDRLERFSDAWIQAGVFAGTDRCDLIDSSEIRSYLPSAITEALAFLKRNLARASHIGEVKRTDIYEIPLTAIREAVINAVVHADYSQRGAPIRIALYVDRLEVENPGLLPFGMTVEEMQLGISKIRNRVIARVCKELGLIEQWGSGVQRINALCQAAGLKAPQYQEVGTHFRVTIFKELIPVSKPAALELNPIKREILRYLKKHGPQSTHMIAQKIDRSTRTARLHLRELRYLGLVTEKGTGPGDPNKVYALVRGSF